MRVFSSGSSEGYLYRATPPALPDRDVDWQGTERETSVLAACNEAQGTSLTALLPPVST